MNIAVTLSTLIKEKFELEKQIKEFGRDADKERYCEVLKQIQQIARVQGK